MTKRMAGFFDVEERLRELSAKGDDLERVKALVDFEIFRPALEAAVSRADRSKGGRPPFDHVLMFKVLILQAMHSLSDERCEYLIKDRLSFMRFLSISVADAVPDANTIWTFREGLKRAGAVDILFRLFDEALRASGFLAMSGQIVDATIVAAPKQRNTQEEKQALREGRIPADWKNKPAKLAQKDRDARWTIKYTKAKPKEDGVPQVDLAIPAFGYKNHIAIDRAHGLIRKWTATHAAAHDGARLEDVLDRDNTWSAIVCKSLFGRCPVALFQLIVFTIHHETALAWFLLLAAPLFDWQMRLLEAVDVWLAELWKVLRFVQKCVSCEYKRFDLFAVVERPAFERFLRQLFRERQ